MVVVLTLIMMVVASGVVAVMRCRDCEYQGKPHKCWLGETKPDEFCSRGKRKEGVDE